MGMLKTHLPSDSKGRGRKFEKNTFSSFFKRCCPFPLRTQVGSVAVFGGYKKRVLGSDQSLPARRRCAGSCGQAQAGVSAATPRSNLTACLNVGDATQITTPGPQRYHNPSATCAPRVTQSSSRALRCSKALSIFDFYFFGCFIPTSAFNFEPPSV